MDSNPRLSFLHLSDIHFHDTRTFDVDTVLRNELEIDLRRIVGEQGNLTGILITGDIAYSGKTEEYEQARIWLRKLTKISGCQEDDVWIVPGNHDVDRNVVSAGAIKKHHWDLRPKPDVVDAKVIKETVESSIRELFDYPGAEQLLLHLANYNAFALRYNCPTLVDKLAWSHDLRLGEFTVRLHGVNSALVSGNSDDKAAGRLLLGTRQSTLFRESHILYLTMCHHPPSWLWEGESIEREWTEHAGLQLFGHDHNHWARQVNNSLVLAAGATHPAGSNSNQARYNVIQLVPSRTNHHVDVTIWPRVYKDLAFKADTDVVGQPTFEKTVNVFVEGEGNLETGMVKEDTHTHSEKQSEDLTARDMQRKLGFDFFGLGYRRIVEIAAKLELIENTDRDLSTTQRSIEYLRRVIERDLRENLRAIIDKELASHGEKD